MTAVTHVQPATEVPGPDPGASPAVATVAAGPRSPWRQAWHDLLRRRAARVALVVVALYVLAGVVSLTPLLDRKIATAVPGIDSYHAPSLSSPDLWLGTDIQGRRVLWRVLYGTRVALLITVATSALSLGIGVVLGVTAGYFGRWVDDVISWLFTTVSAVPWILLVLALIYVFRNSTLFGWQPPELLIIIFAMGLTDWVGICRLIRGEVLKPRGRDYVQAARSIGLGHPRILARHILPNVFHLVIITFSLEAIAYVQAEVALTFLGLGISERPSWGRMIDDAKLELLKGVWWQLVAATVAIGVLCLALNVLGDALRDALDPRTRGAD